MPAPAEGAAPAEAGRAPQLPTPQSTPLIPTLPSDRTDLAYGAYQRGLYVSALKYATARVEANRNDTAAMTLLGELYAQGLAVPQDFAEAASWYRLAQAEIADAQYALAVLYREGRGVPVDRIRMANWLARAADNGNLPAQVEYAIALFNGDGTARSEEEAARWFERAAWRGNPIYQNRMARILDSFLFRPTRWTCPPRATAAPQTRRPAAIPVTKDPKA